MLPRSPEKAVTMQAVPLVLSVKVNKLTFEFEFLVRVWKKLCPVVLVNNLYVDIKGYEQQ